MLQNKVHLYSSYEIREGLTENALKVLFDYVR